MRLFFELVEGTKNKDNCDDYKELVQYILFVFKKICNTSNSFKPNSQSLLRLMTLFTENEIIKGLKA